MTKIVWNGIGFIELSRAQEAGLFFDGQFLHTWLGLFPPFEAISISPDSLPRNAKGEIDRNGLLQTEMGYYAFRLAIGNHEIVLLETGHAIEYQCKPGDWVIEEECPTLFHVFQVGVRYELQSRLYAFATAEAAVRAIIDERNRPDKATSGDGRED